MHVVNTTQFWLKSNMPLLCFIYVYLSGVKVSSFMKSKYSELRLHKQCGVSICNRKGASCVHKVVLSLILQILI